MKLWNLSIDINVNKNTYMTMGDLRIKKTITIGEFNR